MWVIRFLSGPLTGKTIPLKPGKNTIGRTPDCDLQIPDNGISKVHAEIYALEDKVILTDMSSSNGSYINGIRIQSKKIELKDKVSLHNILFDIHPVTAAEARHLLALQRQQAMTTDAAGVPSTPPPQNFSEEIPSAEGMAFGTDDGGSGIGEPAPVSDGPLHQKKFRNLKEFFTYYIDDVALPGVYRLAELTEFKWVLIGFMLALILVVTALSSIPMIQITKASIEKESRRRALTIARNLAKTNEAALLQGVESAVSVESAKLEEGITTALIISHVDGHIIAPVDQMGSYADKPFIHNARRETKEVVSQIDDSTIGASVPIAFYNAQVGSYQVAAHSVVLYDMGSLAVDDGRTLSLFIQTLAMALIIGALIFFFMYRLIEHPIRDINKQLDEALKEGRDNLTTTYQFPALQRLCENLSSLLSRALNGSSDSNSFSYQADKDIEAENILKIMGCPAMAVSGTDSTVIAINEMFETVSDVTIEQLKEKGIDAIPDQAFQLNLSDLVERSQQQASMLASNELELKGVNCELNAQAISNKGQVEYIIITIQQIDGFDEEEAA